MYRWLWLGIVILLFALGLLNVAKAPPWVAWQLSVLAGEFGHWIAPFALGIGIAVWMTCDEHVGVATSTLVMGVCAAALLLKPAVQAWRIGDALTPQFSAQWRGVSSNGSAFSWSKLFLGTPPPSAAVKTLAGPDGLPMDFYAPRPASRGRAAPCVVLVHGGGWDGGERGQIPQLNHWLAQQGYAVAAISYRLAPRFRWPAQREDLLAAIAFLKSRAAELEIDPSRFVLMGRSAGGQIALATAYDSNDPAIRGVIGLYAPSDLAFGYVNTHENDMLKSPSLMRQFLGGTPESARANYESASALLHVTGRTPPTLLLHGENDALVWHRHSVRLDARLAEKGVAHAFVSLPWASHAFDYNLNGPGGQLTTFALEWFLAAVTRP